MEVAERIRASGNALTDAERRVAEVILAQPQAVGFGTVADIANIANVGPATVVRLASKLGFNGYTELQTSVQDDLVDQLRPAAERIHDPGVESPATHAATEIDNIRKTLDAVQPDHLDIAVQRLADLDRPVVVLSGEASTGVTNQFVRELAQLRPGVSVIAGNEIAVRRDIALLSSEATVLAVDLRRYERWLLDAHDALNAKGCWSIALTDNMLSPIATSSDATFIISAASSSPFDSHVGTLALLNLLIADIATALRSPATERLADIERSWAERGSLTDRA